MKCRICKTNGAIDPFTFCESCVEACRGSNVPEGQDRIGDAQYLWFQTHRRDKGIKYQQPS